MRALATALFTGQEKEELEIVLEPSRKNYLALDLGREPQPGILARFVGDGEETVATLELDPDGVISITDSAGLRIIATPPGTDRSPLLGICISKLISGLKTSDGVIEVARSVFQEGDAGRTSLRLECSSQVRVMGRGTGRVLRWGELYYHRGDPVGLCVELTMDWHHLRAGIPLFSTMTAEELVAEGKYRLRFRSYAYNPEDAETTDFVRLFACEEPAEIAVHLTPSLYTPNTPGIPNLAFAVVESERVHQHVVDRCNRMDQIIVPSTFTRDAFVQNGVKCPIQIVSHGVDSEFFRPVESGKSLPGGCGFNFLAIGTHVERKNMKHLVRAFLEEFRGCEDVALYLLLRPEYHATQNNVVLEFTDWEREWADDSAKIFIWTGYLTREHLRNFYANANAYVMPSNEGFGLTLFEAMSCGTPAIGLNYSGVVDFLNEKNGILVKTGKSFMARDIDTLPYVGDRFFEPDIAELRSAMRHLFESPEDVDRLGKRARSDVEKFSWSHVTRQFSEIIEQTHADFHAKFPGQPSRTGALEDRQKITLALCIHDDQNVRKSLDYLRGMSASGFQVLCLFTRYARLRDVMRARDYGFVNYRWDGTLENCKVIARSLFGRHWIIVLNPNEKMVGDTTTLLNFLNSQPPEIAEVSVSCADDRPEPRIFHVRPPGEIAKRAQCPDVSIC
jgi:glycosyltransferase involved in cell wall biosynthesis